MSQIGRELQMTLQSAYREAVSRRALETNERLKDLFTGETARP